MKKSLLFLILLVASLFCINKYQIYAEELNDINEGTENEMIENISIEEEETDSYNSQEEDSNEKEEPIINSNENNEQIINTVNENDSNVDDIDDNEESSNQNEEIEIETGDDTPTSGATVYDIQKVKVITNKVDEEGNPLSGAHLQIIDAEGNIVDDWISDGNPRETLLSDGTYILHEVEAPEGYDKAEDKEFIVKVEIAELDAGADYSATPCPHYLGTAMYYVEIEGKKHEVYCINQNWETPDDNSQYDGEILDAPNIRDYTKQTVPVGLDDDDPKTPIMSDEPIDISDKSLTDQELYDKILDIIYHRHIAAGILATEGYTYTVEEIRFITEVALKNYTNADITERQYNVNATDELLNAFDAAGVIYKTYYVGSTKKVSYIKHNYRDYVYDPDVPLGQNIVRTDYGKGNSFGQMVAGHWNSYSNTNYLHPDADPSTQAHNAKNNQEERDTVARYYRLFQFLISNENSHPNDMHLYIYSSNSVPQDSSGNDNDAKYQNLLGITGYFEDIEQQEQEIEMVNNYSTEKREISVKKVWEDKEDYNKLRPTSVIVNLYADNVLYKTIELNAENNWEYTFKDLYKYSKGKEIIYTIKEEIVPEYFTEIEGDADTGFTITNTHFGQGDGDEPNPKTGDNIFTYYFILILSIIGLIRMSFIYYKNN